MFTATFEILLFACQQEKFYEFYLTLVVTASKIFEKNQEVLGEFHYKPASEIEIKKVSFSIRDRQGRRPVVWSVTVENLGIQYPLGRIQLSSSSEEVVDAIVSAVQGNSAHFSPVINVTRQVL